MKVRFLLKVRQAGSSCLFDLSQMGSQASQNAVLRYPGHLIAAYQQWIQAYLGYYGRSGILPAPLPLPDELRGRPVASGQASASPLDRYSLLAQAEAALLADFHLWLRSPNLHDIRVTLARASDRQQDFSRPPVELGILCTDEPQETIAASLGNPERFDLARLPWESWEINPEFAARGQIQISRIPNDLPERPPARVHSVSWRRPRILVILGDDRGLDFRREKAAMASLAGIADIKFAGWQPSLDRTETIQTIRHAIAAEPGWDILYFAGHSNETEFTGGELSLAPGISVSIQDLTAQIQQARKQGLQFALFNSCQGSEIAKALIHLGLGQVN